MKQITIALFSLLVFQSVNAQKKKVNGFAPKSNQVFAILHTASAVPDCNGKCDISESYSEWVTTDTLGTVKDTVRNWVYNKEISTDNSLVYLVNYPCGCGGTDTYQQERICSITGIRQIRNRFVYHNYIPAPPTPYEQTLQKFKKP